VPGNEKKQEMVWKYQEVKRFREFIVTVAALSGIKKVGADPRVCPQAVDKVPFSEGSFFY